MVNPISSKRRLLPRAAREEGSDKARFDEDLQKLKEIAKDPKKNCCCE
jgi:hypothetical protein